MEKGDGQRRRTNGASRRVASSPIIPSFYATPFHKTELTYKGHVQQIIPIERASVVVCHRWTQALVAVEAEVTAQIVKRQGERVHRVHDELDLGLLLVPARCRESQLGRAQGDVMIAEIGALHLLIVGTFYRHVSPQVAAEHLFPVFPEPRVSPIGVGRARPHVLVEAGDVFRL